MDAAQTRRVRGWILQFLADAPAMGDGDPAVMGSDMLVELVSSAGMPVVREEVERQLSYLKDKKLIAVEALKGQARRIAGSGMLARITSDGRDIVDGTTRDAGISMGAFAS
jgi:hypothetical protein